MTTVVPRRPYDADFFSTVLRDAGVDRNSAVRVTGRDGLAPLIWLCRRGFDDVAYIRSGGCGPRTPGDVLIVLHSAPLAELQQLLGDHSLLREGGVLIVRTPDLRQPDGSDPVHLLLERAGYRVDRCIARRSSEVHVACHLGAPVLRRAA